MHIVSAVRLRRWAIRGLSKAHLAVYRMTRGRVLGSVAGNAGASAHHNRSAVRKGAHDTAHVLSRCDRPRGDRIERRRGPTTRLVAQPAADTARGRPRRERLPPFSRAQVRTRDRVPTPLATVMAMGAWSRALVSGRPSHARTRAPAREYPWAGARALCDLTSV
jgi:hypothetical protein